MFKNSERFLTSFNKIEKGLKSLMVHRKDVGFSKAVKILRNSNALVKRYSDDLLELAELRNAIVHNKINITYAIAEPHDSIVDKIEAIEKELSHPKKVTPKFSRNVYSFQQSDALTDMLVVIHEKAVSKFPIYDGNEFKGLVTQKGITNWLAENSEENFFSSTNTLLKDVLPYEENDNYKFIRTSTSVYEALELFKQQIGKGRRLEALLITKNGASSEKLLGIITAWDILEIP